MIDLANVRWTDLGARSRAAYNDLQQFREDRARMQAGNALKSGNYGGATQALYGAGMLDAGQELERRQATMQQAERELARQQRADEKTARDEKIEAAETIAARMSAYYQQGNKDPERLAAAYDSMAPTMLQYGAKPEDIARDREALLRDPQAWFAMTGAAIDQAKGIEYRTVGDEVVVFRNGVEISRHRGERSVAVSDGGSIYRIPGNSSAPGQPDSVPLSEPPPEPPSDWLGDVSKAAPDATVSSGYRTPQRNAQVGGVPGSLHTQGRAVDLVPRPGETMAQLYERVRRIPGVRAINEGDHVHVQEVGQGGAPAPTSQPATTGQPQLLIQRPKASEAKWVTEGNIQRNTVTGEVKSAPSASASPPKGAGLTDMGNGYYRDRVGRIYQPNSVGVLQQTAGVTDEAVKTTARNVSGLNTILQAVDEYDRATRAMSRGDFGPKGKYLGDPGKFATAQTAATNLIMLAKSPEFYNLGVITGPDLAILESVVQNPAKFATYFLQNKIQPSLRQIAVMIGQKYRGEAAAFATQGGDPTGLQPLWRPPRSTGQSAPSQSIRTSDGTNVTVTPIAGRR